MSAPAHTSSNYPLSTIHYPPLRSSLLRWYRHNQRQLPWRKTKDPYKIWVSEIMLQQTRVAAVLEYYARFLRRFPDVASLAQAREAEVLAAWSGLGYYGRARNLHRAASVVMQRGAFPRAAAELRELPGIGRYTAAAIASIAFGEPCAVVDGNVERVLARMAGRKLGAGETWGLAQELVSSQAPGNFNQAVMELGATVCLPGEPLCGKCPVARWCQSSRRPSVFGRRPPSARRKATAVYLLNVRERHVLLKRRPRTARVMPGMWELPHICKNGKCGPPEPHLRLRHSITVTDYDVYVVRSQARPRGARWISLSRIEQLPLTGLARKILRSVKVM